MALKLKCLDVEVQKWKIKTGASNLFGGMFRINLFATNSYMEWSENDPEFVESKSVFFPRSSLQRLSFSRKADKLLRAALQQYPLLRRCNDLDSLATSVAAYLCCKYHFSPEILLGGGPYKPIIYIDLQLIVQEQDSSLSIPKNGGNLDDQLNKLIILRKDAKLIKDVIRKCYTSVDAMAQDTEEVEGGLVKRPAAAVATNDDGGSDSSEQMNCPICLEGFRKYEDGAMRASCAHEFHERCITRWLLKNDSCPMCRSACSVLV